MSSRNASRLDPGLIARKGQAAPATASEATTPAAAAPAAPTATNGVEPRGGVQPSARGLHGTIAVTVRLDPARYERLKVHGARVRRTNQEILVEALDDFFQTKA